MRKSSRSHILWISPKSSRKVLDIFIHPYLIKVFALLVLACLCLLPLSEMKLLKYSSRIDQLERQKRNLQRDVSNLKYIRQALVRIEEKEKRLKNYFGLDGYLALDKVVGGGDTSLELSTKGTGGGSNEYGLIASVQNQTSLYQKLNILEKNYEILGKLADKKVEIWERTPSIIPVTGQKVKISSEFGWRTNPFTQKKEFHAGIDIMGTNNTQIIAPAFGVVLTIGYDQRLGKYIVIEHQEGIKTIYGHLDKILIKEGVMIHRGDVVALMGNSGLSTSTHLHYAVLVDQKAVDPRRYILDWQG